MYNSEIKKIIALGIFLMLGFVFSVSKSQAATNTAVATSAVLDMTKLVDFTTVNWTETIPAGTSIAVRAHAGNVLAPDSSWTIWYTFSNGESLNMFDGLRYLQYEVTLNSTNDNNVPTLQDISFNYGDYPTAGIIASSPYNSGSPANVLAKLTWTENIPAGTDAQFQVRTSPDNTTWTSWMGPDGTTDTFYTDSSGSETIPAALSDGVNDQWFQYKTFLSTTDSSKNPTVSAVNLQYVVNASPEIRNVSAAQGADGIVSVNYDVRDPDTSTGFTSNKVTSALQYCSANCADIGNEVWTDATSVSGDVGANVTVAESTWSSGYQVLWNAKADFPAQYNITNFKVRVKINDNEGANNLSLLESAQFILDTKLPIFGQTPFVDATAVPGVITSELTDESDLFMIASLNSDLSGASWQPYNATKNITLATNPDTVYVQYKDAYGNISSIIPITTPETPDKMMIQDTSNVLVTPAETRLFIAWKTITAPLSGFSAYKIYRSMDQANWELQGAVTDRLTNYYGDSTVLANVDYYYRVIAEDVNGSKSGISAVVNGKANGLQDAGEGGGGIGNVAPIITSVNTTNITTTSATITWTTNNLADSMVGFSQTQADFSSAQGVGSMVTSHSVTLTGLSANKTYYYQVKSADPLNALAVDSNGGNGFTFTTALADTTAPTISAVNVLSKTAFNAVIVWETNELSDSFVEYSKTSGFAKGAFFGDNVLNTSHSVNVPSLEANTTYYFKVHSKDLAGNDAVSTQQNFTTDTSGDVTPPAISAVSSSATFNSASITWDTDEPSSSYVEYGVNDTYGRIYGDNALSFTHSVQLPYDLEPLTLYHFRVHSTDGTGNAAISTDATFTTIQNPADSTAPTISGVIIGSATTSSVTVTWNTNEPATSYVGYSLDGNNFAEQGSSSLTSFHSVTLVGLTAETGYYLKVVSSDASKNKATDDNFSLYYIISTATGPQAPLITEISVDSIDTTSATITWTTDSNADSFVEYGLDNSYGNSVGKNDSVKSHIITISNLASPATYHFRVRSRAVSETVSGDNTLTTTADVSSAAISEISPQSIAKDSATIAWTTNEDTDSILQYGKTSNYDTIKGDKNDHKTDHTVSLDKLEPLTTYHYQIQSKDASGNVAISTDQTFTTLADNDSPTISELNIEAANENSVVITWKTDKDASTELIYGTDHDLALNAQTALFGQTHFITITGLEMGQKYYFKAFSQDAYGNEEKSAENNFQTSPDPVLNHNPLTKIENIEHSIITDTKVVVSFTTDQAAKCGITYGTISGTDNYGEIPVVENIFSTSHAMHLASLIYQTQYFYEIACVDNLDNAVSSSEQTVTTLEKQIGESQIPGGIADTTAPVISGIEISAINGESAKLTWVTDEKASSSVAYGNVNVDDNVAGNNIVNKSRDNYLTQHEVIISNLIPATKYLFKASSLDTSGNISESSESSFTTSEPTSLSSVRVQSLSLGQATITWNTGNPTTSLVEYGTNSSYGDKKEQTSMTKDHSVSLSNLTAGEIYHFRVKGKDSNGILYSSTDNTFQPKSPPIISGISVGSVTEHEAKIEFETDVPTDAIATYTNAENEKQTGSQGNPTLTKKHSLNIGSLDPGITFLVKIKVRDEQGNETQQDVQSFTTGKDITVPKIDMVKTDSALTQNDKVQTIISWTTNELSTGQVIYSEASGVRDARTLDVSATPSYNHVAVITSFKSGTTYNFKVKSVDEAGNEGFSTQYAIRTPTKTQNIIQVIITNFTQIFGWAKF